MTPADPTVDGFAELLMRLVRDESIDGCESLLNGEVRGRRAEHWREVVTQSGPKDALGELIPDIVDQVLFSLLDAIDSDSLLLAWRPEDGSWTSLSELGHGEMAGWLMSGKGGWIDKFSAKRFFDPLSELP